MQEQSLNSEPHIHVKGPDNFKCFNFSEGINRGEKWSTIKGTDKDNSISPSLCGTEYSP